MVQPGGQHRPPAGVHHPGPHVPTCGGGGSHRVTATRGHADPARSQELFHVLAGTLTLVTASGGDERAVTVPTGGSARLDSDRPYAYRNDGARPCEFVRTVSLAP